MPRTARPSVFGPLLLASLALGPSAGAQDEPWQEFVETTQDDLVAFYRDLHRHPELSFREVRTAARLAEALESAGLTVTRNVGGLGVVAVLENGDGPCVLLRADLDALPLGERTGLPYQSEQRVESPDGRIGGIMHACGHDVHMTSLWGTARYLATHRDAWKGTLVCIGQPAEERAGGAKAMLEDGLFERFPRPDAALAIHVTHELETGTIGYRAGPAMANVESVDVVLHGKGGHGAAPHLTIDPIVLAAKLILDLQTIPSRELNPTDPSVVTVGAIQGGQKHNIIEDRCELQITIRSYTPEVHEHIKEAIRRKAGAVAASAGAPEPEVRFSEFTPALVNDPQLVARVLPALRRVLGEDHVVPASAVMTAEDFGRFGEAGVPIFMFRVGSIRPARMAALRQAGEEPPPLHSSFYWPDARETILTAVQGLSAATIELMPR